MVPWPIALLAIFYACIASSSALMLVQAGRGISAWPAAWGALSALLVWGLVMMKPWARRLAVWSSAAMTLAALLNALMAVIPTPPNPKLALAATGIAGLQLVIIRYLTRPRVRSWFIESTARR